VLSVPSDGPGEAGAGCGLGAGPPGFGSVIRGSSKTSRVVMLGRYLTKCKSAAGHCLNARPNFRSTGRKRNGAPEQSAAAFGLSAAFAV
jgi:hypothetical protein